MIVIDTMGLYSLGWKYYVRSQTILQYSVSNSSLLYKIFYIVWLAIETVFVYFFILETKNKSLEETAVSVLI